MKICSASLIISEMQIKTTPHTCQNGYHQKVYTSQILERMWRKGNPCALLVRMQTGAATMENSMEVPQKTENIPSVKHINSTHGYLSKENKNTNSKDICTPMFNAALFTIAKIWKQSKCLLTDKRIKMWCIYTR